jgi:hypothetical protein
MAVAALMALICKHKTNTERNKGRHLKKQFKTNRKDRQAEKVGSLV